MELPLDIQQLCEQYLEKVRHDPEHQLERPERYKLYESFQPACFNFPQRPKKGNSEDYDQYLKNNFQNMNTGDRTLSWLGILTVQKVLAGWEKLAARKNNWQKKYLGDIKNMLQDSQDLLAGKLGFPEANKRLLDRYWYFTHFFVKADLGYLKNAAIYMFSVVIYGGKEYEVAGDAATAYTIIDYNRPGDAELFSSPLPFEYNHTKRLEFWEWWLTEAIPQAWELAQRTFPTDN